MNGFQQHGFAFPPEARFASPPPGEIRHRPPKMPISIDGSREDPRAIAELNGQRLHYVLDKQALDLEMLSIFTDQAAAETHLAETIGEALAPSLEHRASVRPATGWDRLEMLGARPANPELFVAGPTLSASDYPPGGVPIGGGYLDLYEDEDWGGCTWRINEWEHTHNLSDLWACGFLWWGWINADLKVTCVDSRISGVKPVTILADQQNLGGAWFWTPGRSFITSLVPYGWNDRARSVTWLYFA
jgi:hypothetical protein